MGRNQDFRIDFNGMNEVIGFLSRAMDQNLEIEFDPINNGYVVDGVEISLNFLAETQAKMSHYINTVNRLLITANDKYQKDRQKGLMKKIVSEIPDEKPDPGLPTKIVYADDKKKDGKNKE